MTQATAADFMCIGVVIGIGLSLFYASVKIILDTRAEDRRLLGLKSEAGKKEDSGPEL